MWRPEEAGLSGFTPPRVCDAQVFGEEALQGVAAAGGWLGVEGANSLPWVQNRRKKASTRIQALARMRLVRLRFDKLREQTKPWAKGLRKGEVGLQCRAGTMGGGPHPSWNAGGASVQPGGARAGARDDPRHGRDCGRQGQGRGPGQEGGQGRERVLVPGRGGRLHQPEEAVRPAARARQGRLLVGVDGESPFVCVGGGVPALTCCLRGPCRQDPATFEIKDELRLEKHNPVKAMSTTTRDFVLQKGEDTWVLTDLLGGAVGWVNLLKQDIPTFVQLLKPGGKSLALRGAEIVVKQGYLNLKRGEQKKWDKRCACGACAGWQTHPARAALRRVCARAGRGQVVQGPEEHAAHGPAHHQRV
jgi:hypothetical protein